VDPAPPNDLRRLVRIADDPAVPTLLRSSTVARMIGMTPDAFRKWRNRGGGPPAQRFGPRWMYDEQTVHEWITQYRPADPADDHH
jgi:hypothetical protein